ncbi:TRAP transporter large permease [Desertibacillus haloalkaliphilus]|uniref:TRAP transporter large permease n=1 Tax=Desertibacillus haloalkaliphilus TaxID=1328930 RepID=UPI001C26C780|nr:TRAP transporter large permease [Desertibacillus haloalkaliphilus]MBU8906121.1 TRAP transporter large permease [Desertibacillus haloalkaliphilus]
MSAVATITIVIILFTILLLSGLYIHSVLLASGVIGLILLDGFGVLEGLLGNQPYHSVATYSLSTIPLFILMAQFILQTDIVKDYFNIVHRISHGSGGFLGGLTIVAGGFLGAVSGSGTASSAALGQVAVPELNKRGFSPPLSGAIAATGGSLSSIIPPSVTLIIYGIATETPISQLFMGAVLPGVLTALVFILVMFFLMRSSWNKRNIVSTDEDSDYVKIAVTRLIIITSVALIIIGVIFGGIYMGFVTPTEAGAVGAFVAFLCALVLGKVNKTFFMKSISETVKTSVMVMLILIGAQVFGRFISLSLVPRRLIELLEPIMAYPALVLGILLIVYFFLFMFIEGAAVILMTTPVALPIISALNVDPLWFGVFVSVIGTIGLITPPVGISVYAVSGSSRISSDSIFRFTLVFAIVTSIVVGGVMIAFPDIALWLPNSMK